MFFDTLSGIAERHLPEFIPVLKRARLFRMEGRGQHVSVTGAIESWHPDERTVENFRLPFETAAVEYCDRREGTSDSCVVFRVRDAAARQLDFVAGWGHADGTADVAAGSVVALPDAGEVIEWRSKVFRPAAALRMWTGTKKGGVRCLPPQVVTEDDVQGKSLSKWREISNADSREELMRKCREAKMNIQRLGVVQACLHVEIAILSVLVINEPAAFVVEEAPLRPRPDPPGHAVPRSAGRPHYIVLNPRQIRERFLYPNGVPEEDGPEDAEKRKVTPHERRGHYRRLQADRFKAARGQVLWIEPMWVGPSEAVNGVNRYTVRLDL